MSHERERGYFEKTTIAGTIFMSQRNMLVHSLNEALACRNRAFLRLETEDHIIFLRENKKILENAPGERRRLRHNGENETGEIEKK